MARRTPRRSSGAFFERPSYPPTYHANSAPQALVHTAGRHGVPSRTVRPLIRTVLTDTNRPTRMVSPAARARASGRVERTSRTMWLREFMAAPISPLFLPERAFICARRAIRREVLLARLNGPLGRRLAGSAGGFQRSRNKSPAVNCSGRNLSR